MTSNHPFWLTVPVKYADQDTKINSILIDNSKRCWVDHQKSIIMSYRKSLGLPTLEKLLTVYERQWTKLVDLNIITKYLRSCVK
ncbi:hypothetical protein DL897_07710 [Thermoflavimicrobium daqui]|uniref:Uncharacterized protein n=1 Tax=Thermoflavimicrobium daqui TaxID=2137476 RepID=A0A364K6P0_9BACL|nr:hypothetical protein DL897_07710 [Thermoflavimicrobium daqui]